MSFCRLLIWVGSSSIWLLNMFNTSRFFSSVMFGGTAARERQRERERERKRDGVGVVEREREKERESNRTKDMKNKY